MRRPLAWIVLVLIIALGLAAAAQRRGFFRSIRNVVYDGRFTFVRAEYRQYGGWAADYPTMETNLNQIQREITELRPHSDGTNVHAFDDPELFKYPIAYLSEPGYWYPSETEVLGLRQYLHILNVIVADASAMFAGKSADVIKQGFAAPAAGTVSEPIPGVGEAAAFKSDSPFLATTSAFTKGRRPAIESRWIRRPRQEGPGHRAAEGRVITRFCSGSNPHVFLQPLRRRFAAVDVPVPIDRHELRAVAGRRPRIAPGKHDERVDPSALRVADPDSLLPPGILHVV